MPSFWWQQNPGLKKVDDNKFEIFHNHHETIDYLSFGVTQKKKLNQQIDQEKVALKGCIAFFKAIADEKTTDPKTRATALGAAAEDEARLADFDAHKSCCTIL